MCAHTVVSTRSSSPGSVQCTVCREWVCSNCKAEDCECEPDLEALEDEWFLEELEF